MNKGDYLSTLLRSENSVFSFKDVVLLWNSPGTNTTRVRIHYYVKKHQLYPLRRGIYAKDKNYNRLELATKLLIPSYVSFETVLNQAGIIFQFYRQIFIASYLTREVQMDGQTYSFRRIKKFVLTDSMGVVHQDNYSIATKERAFLDTIYLNINYHFDNLQPLDWDKVFEMLPIYKNKRMEKSVHEFYKDFKSNP